jgi:L-asparaginase
VSLLEDNELFNAGIGSQIQSDGKIRMSAAIMEGNPRMSGVINIEEVKNPVQVAQILMQYDDRVLEVVRQIRTENGFESFSTEIPQRRTEYEEKLKSSGTGTVGCVALIKTGK